MLRNNGAKPEGSFYDTEEMPEDLIPNLYISAHQLYPFSSYENVESVTVRRNFLFLKKEKKNADTDLRLAFMGRESSIKWICT